MFARILLSLSIFALAGGLFLGFSKNQDGYGLASLLSGEKAGAAETYTVSDSPAVAPEEVSALEKQSEENVKLVESVIPSIVSINTTQVVTQRAYARDMFFGIRPFMQKLARTGLGSGVIVTREGHVITNYHVIAKVDEIQVTTHDGTKSLATVEGFDENVDIAVLKIQNPKVKEYKPLAFADSDVVKVGATVWAFGNPFGLDETVTNGIISHRDRQTIDSALPQFQHNAVIEPGNSGGPLVNHRGEIIGINNAIFNVKDSSQAASWQGISFAIPSNDAKRSFERIMSKAPPSLGYLGLRAENLRRRQSPGDASPVVIAEVFSGSPAEKAGLKPGDVVQRVAGKPVNNRDDFYQRINRWPIGKAVEIAVLRDDETVTVNAVVADAASASSEEDRQAERKDLRDQIGIEVSNLTPRRRAELQMSPDDPGIEVTSVERGSAAENTFMPKDLILMVNSTPVASTDEFLHAIKELTLQRRFNVMVYRQRYGAIPLTVELPR